MAAALPRDLASIRCDFPALGQLVHGKPLVYLDSAASAQKPHHVIEATTRFYSNDYANVHRGVHTLSQRATDLFEAAREKVRLALHASDVSEIIFTKGCTEGINLVAQAYARPRLKPGDEILVTAMEHHSNFVPWQIVAEQTGAKFVVAPLTDNGEINLEIYKSLLNERTKIAAMVHVSNAIGTINPVQEMVAVAHQVGAVCVVDGAQAGPHMAVDVRALDADFYTLSCHKMYAPTGVGVLYGKASLLASLEPYQSGGGMIRKVTAEKTTYAEPPDRFEPGTPNIAGAIGLAAALDFLAGKDLGEAWTRQDFVVAMDVLNGWEHELLVYGTARLQELPFVRLIGTATDKAAILSFTVDGVHPHDVGQILDSEGVAVRVGHHCTQPLMAHFGVPATVRASLGIYNQRDDIDALVRGLHKVKEVFG